MDFRWRTERLRAEELGKKSLYEIELAAASALGQGAKKYSQLLEILCSIQKFRTPLMLYACARALAESAPSVRCGYPRLQSGLEPLEGRRSVEY